MEPLFPIEAEGPAHPHGPADAPDAPDAPDPPAPRAERTHAARPDRPAHPVQRVFLTATEVGQQLGIRKSRVYELAAAGLLPVVRLGRRMRFPRRGLEELATAAIERAKAEVLGRDGRDGLDESAAAFTRDRSAQVGHGNGTRGRRVA